MTARCDRRRFLHSATALVGAGLAAHWAPPGWAAPAADPLFKISLAEWSLHRTLFAGKLDHLDFAKTAREAFDIDGVEYVNQFFKDKQGSRAYLDDMKQRAADHGVRGLLIMIDSEGKLGDPDETMRRQIVENHKPWVEAAALLGCHSIRVNAGSSGSYEEQRDRAADGLHALTLFAEQHQLNVIVENHGGLSSNGKWLASVIQQVDHPHCGTLPDFGNFSLGNGESYDVYQGVAELMPFAQAVSAKSYDFDPARPDVTIRDPGAESQLVIDYPRMMKIVVDAGYRGFVGIEYEGRDADEYAGIRNTKALLERTRDALTSSAAP